MCDSVACSSKNPKLLAPACRDIPNCGKKLLDLVALMETAARCSCCVEALCGCIPSKATVNYLALIQSEDPKGYHNPVQCTGDLPNTTAVPACQISKSCVPTASDYNNLVGADKAIGIQNWPQCTGPFALCSFANCSIIPGSNPPQAGM